MKTSGGMVLKDEPVFTPIGMPVNLHMASQPGFQPRNAIPGLAQKGFRH